MTTLRRQMIQDMAIRGLSDKTQEAYVRAVATLAQFYGRFPERISDRSSRGPAYAPLRSWPHSRLPNPRK